MHRKQKESGSRIYVQKAHKNAEKIVKVCRKFFRTFFEKILHFADAWYIIANVVTLIALKREVAVKTGFYAERMSSYEN